MLTKVSYSDTPPDPTPGLPGFQSPPHCGQATGQIVLNSLLAGLATATVPKVVGFDTVKEGRMRQTADLKRAADMAPNTENGTVVVLPGREGAKSRRQYLTEKEVTQLCDAARARG